jgi:biopolymer transport protein ExbD
MSMKLSSATGSITDINMTPLIDVMLVLLIIIIISLPPVTHAVKIDNPQTQIQPPAPPPTVVNLGIDFDGALSWNGSPVDRKTLQGYITEQASEDPQPEVHIAVDKFAQYSKVAQTLADLQSRGLKKIGFINNSLL